MAIEPCEGDEDDEERQESKRMTGPRASDSGQGGSGTGKCEKNSDKKLLGKTESRSRNAPRVMNGAEIRECGECENGVALASGVWHGASHEHKGNGCCCDGYWEKRTTVFPVEMMSRA